MYIYLYIYIYLWVLTRPVPTRVSFRIKHTPKIFEPHFQQVAVNLPKSVKHVSEAFSQTIFHTCERKIQNRWNTQSLSFYYKTEQSKLKIKPRILFFYLSRGLYENCEKRLKLIFAIISFSHQIYAPFPPSRRKTPGECENRHKRIFTKHFKN